MNLVQLWHRIGKQDKVRLNKMKMTYKSLQRNSQRGSMLVELLLSVALAMLIIPFVFKYQRSAIERQENIMITKQMTEIQDALERYIIDNREELLKPYSRNIVRVNITDLAEYGLNENIINNPENTYQLRIVKSRDFQGQSSLQGVVVYDSDKITPFRTHQILNLASGRVGFVDGNRAYGANGTWRASIADLGVDSDSGIVGTTNVNRDSALYLWRVPSDNKDDATMRSALNMGERDILNIKNISMINGYFDEFLNVGKLVSNDLIFDNRTTIDGGFATRNATVSGTLTADSRSMEISGRLSLSDTGKFSSFTTNDLYVTNLTLPTINIDAPEKEPVILSVNGTMQMRYGRVSAMQVTVGYAGSITPSLTVSQRIIDPTNQSYYWDALTSDAVLADLYLVDLNRMLELLAKSEFDSSTVAGRTFGAVASNVNATVSDYLNALETIAAQVRVKYSLLKLQ